LFAEKGRIANRLLPPNVRYIEFSEKEFEVLVRRKIGVFPRRWRSYKICDFRPAFGHLFEEYFEGHEFWGYCDTDLIFGNISKFLTPEILADHDRIFASGHLSLIRNSEKLRLLYQEGEGVLNFRHVFATGESLIFDEWQGFYKICVKAGLRQYLHGSVVADIDPDSFRLRVVGKSRNYPDQVFVWERGRLLRLYRSAGKINEEEFIYIHLQKRGFVLTAVELGETFLINPGSFLSYRDRSEVFNHGCFLEFFPWWHGYLNRRMRNLVQMIVNKCFRWNANL
jgi:hypothetical protein